MTPEDVHRVTFTRAPFGRRGYRQDDVDELLDHIAAALSGRSTLSAGALQKGLRSPRGPFGRGYHADEVDAFLDRVRAQFGF